MKSTVFNKEIAGEDMASQKVAFVCLHGSAKSLIAAEYFNRIAIERNLPLRATTSGPEPDREVPGSVVAGLKSHGIDVRQYHPALSRPSNSPTPASRGFAVGDE